MKGYYRYTVRIMLQILFAVIALYSIIRIELRSCHIRGEGKVVAVGNPVDFFNLRYTVLSVKVFVEILFDHVINLGFGIREYQAPPLHIPHEFCYRLKVFI
ncbi:hypothetical protein D3C75_1199640 [compost metagenome]